MADRDDAGQREAFAVGPVTAHPASMELSSAFGRSAVEPKVMALFSLLAQQPGKVWTRKTLLDQLWGDSAVGDENLTRTVYLLRKGLRDPHGLGDAIKTVPKRGYQLRVQSGNVKPTRSSELRVDHSVAVLPLQPSGPEDESDFLADGLCSDLTNQLSRVPELYVAPHSSSLRAPDASADLGSVCRLLRVRYLVTGTFKRKEQNIRIRVELVDGSVGGTVWSQKYDSRLDDFFEVQDDIVRSIATTISSEIEVAALKAVLTRPKFELSVYQLLQSAEAERWKYSRSAVEKIVHHLQTALEISPNQPLVHAGLAVQFAQNLLNGWSESDYATTLAAAEAHLVKAQAEAPHHPSVLAAAGIVRSYSGQIERAIPYLERAMQLNPSDPHVRAFLGFHRCVFNGAASDLELIRSAERDAPHHPRYAIWANYRGIALFRLGEFSAALEALEDCVVRDPNYTPSLFLRALPLVCAGHVDEARAKIAEGLRFDPNVSRDTFVYRMVDGALYCPDGVDLQEVRALLLEAWPT